MSFTYRLTDDGKKMEVQDPLYGQILIPSPFKEIILTKEMQRLEHISQTGFSSYDYPGLKNNERLSHSIGAFFVMSRMIEHLEKELKKYNISISKNDKDMALCSMLLHDIGHGPFSHTCEKVTKYSHEKRTTDILLGDTEVNHILSTKFGKNKVKKIASYIAEIDDSEEKDSNASKNCFTKLLKSLISHQIDADRLDYLARDSYLAGIRSAIDYKKLIESMEICIDNDQEYELLINHKGLACIETILIEHFQKYRDIYHTKSSDVLDHVFFKILERYRENPQSVSENLPKSFTQFALSPTTLSLDDFLEMTDVDFFKSFEIIKEHSNDPLLKYLCDLSKTLDDFQSLDSSINPKLLKQKLSEIFEGKDFSNTFSVLQIKSKIKLYKREESLRINYGNVHKDLSEATPHLIKPEQYLEKCDLFFNLEVLRLELGMTEIEFKPYREEIQNMLNELNKKPEEFELKYTIDDNSFLSQDSILHILLQNGFKIVKQKNKENNDEYYDTRELDLLKKGGSLRTRKITQDGKKCYKATYKMPSVFGEVYSSREEIEVELEHNSIDELKSQLSSKNIDVDLNDILPNPLLNSKTQRRDVILEKNGVQVCLSFDQTLYSNHVLQNQFAEDFMIEIEALGDVENRIILNEINDILQNAFPNLKTNKQSKYERGIKKTREAFKKSKAHTEPDYPEL